MSTSEDTTTHMIDDTVIDNNERNNMGKKGQKGKQGNNENNGDKKMSPFEKLLSFFNKRRSFILCICILLIIILVFVVVLPAVSCRVSVGWKVVLDVLLALIPSIIAGLIVAMYIDTPGIIHSFREMLINTLASEDYLDEQDSKKLEKIRQKVVALLHKDSSRVPLSFLELDNELCRLIDSPYYEYFNESIVVSKKNEYDALIDERFRNDETAKVSGSFFKKDVQIEFRIKNPKKLKPEETVMASIGITKFMDLPKECKMEACYVFKSFEVTIDNEETYDITPVLWIQRCKSSTGRVSDPNTMTYDTVARLCMQNNKPLDSTAIKTFNNINNKTKYDSSNYDTNSELEVSFKDCVQVRICYSQIYPAADSHYTRRLKYAACSYMLSYTCLDNYVLHGQVLGTLIKQSDMSIMKNNVNNITLLCRNWLLPKNGAFVVMDDVINKQ